MGVSIGFWSPKLEIGDVDRLCDRIIEICGPTSAGFPFVASPVEDETEDATIYYAVINGHVPIHIDRPNRKDRETDEMFMFVLAAENRPVLMCAPAIDEISRVILVPDTLKAPRMMMGGIELKAGTVIHMDIAGQWHGITGFPTGDLDPNQLPHAVMVQVPWKDKTDIQGALNRLKRIIGRDDRFADMVRQPA